MQKSPNKGTILLYNIEGKPYEKTLKLLLLRLGFRSKTILPDMYKQQLGYLIGLKDFTATPDTPIDSEIFTDEMLIFHGINNTHLDLLLKELKKAKLYIPLKAIVTPHNILWDSIYIHKELCDERAKFQELKEKKE